MHDRHAHGEHDNEQSNHDDAEDEKHDEQMTEDELMMSIERAASQHDEQRLFWDDQLKQMNRWANL